MEDFIKPLPAYLWTAKDPLPPINRAYSIASQIEKQKVISGAHEETQVSAMVVVAQKSYNGNHNSGMWYGEKKKKKKKTKEWE